MGVKEIRSIADDETVIYWDGWNAAMEAAACVLERELGDHAEKKARANAIRGMKHDEAR